MVYEWKKGVRFSADARKVYEELQSIEGPKTPEAVAAKAKNENTELHQCGFEWDVQKAAEAQWREQARRVLRSIVIVPDEDDAEDVVHVIRAFENVSCDEGRAYVPIERVLRNQEWREEVFAEIRAGITDLERKAEAYEHISEKLTKVRQRLKAAREPISA